jgi:hypothetical protein
MVDEALLETILSSCGVYSSNDGGGIVAIAATGGENNEGEAGGSRRSGSSSSGCSNPVFLKAKEILRKMEVKFPSGTLRKAENTRYAIAIELACRILNQSFDKKMLMQGGSPRGGSSASTSSSIDTIEYNKNLMVVKNALQIEINSVCASELLSIRFGESIKIAVNQLLTDHFSKQSTSARQSSLTRTNWDNSIVCAAYYIILKDRKVCFLRTVWLACDLNPPNWVRPRSTLNRMRYYKLRMWMSRRFGLL